MKKVAMSALAVLVACPAFAMNHPDQGSSWQMWGMDPYIGLRGGMSYTNLNYKYDKNKESMTDFILFAIWLIYSDLSVSDSFFDTSLCNSTNPVSFIRKHLCGLLLKLLMQMSQQLIGITKLPVIV